ncbi:spermidine synthase, partial [Pseudomonas syringae]|nr:spermidine synthase [Pseudomonas syringae]
VQAGNFILIVPADLDQTLDVEALSQRAEALAPHLGYSLDTLIKAVRSAT